jgi:hypothetical protein
MSDEKLQGHGEAGRRETAFSRLLGPRLQKFDVEELKALADAMIAKAEEGELEDGRDAEENLFVPAGYTYFSQFVDHDVTFETTSNLEAGQSPAPTNLRTPRLDLDCLYGSGPDDQPFMYGKDGASLLPDDENAVDLLRIPPSDPNYGRAVIGDKRNDENSIVCQIQLAFIKFHNKVVKAFAEQGLTGPNLFVKARNEVRWTYQRIVLEDLLARVIDHTVYDFFMQQRAEKGDRAYVLYSPDKRWAVPLEFAGAAYRFGHSMVRTGYRLNRETKRVIFNGGDSAADSLVGFQPLPTAEGKSHVIDTWGRFFPSDDSLPPGERLNANTTPSSENDPAPRLQFAYKLDTSLVDPLRVLPQPVGGGRSLAELNLLRGNLFDIQTGQAFAALLGEKALDAKYLVTRQEAEDGFTYVPIDATFATATPLWFYILAEAQKPVVDLWREKGANLTDDDFFSGPGSCAQLGSVGGRIVLEVFNGLIDADPESFRYAQDWQPLIGDTLTMTRLLSFTGLRLDLN